MTFEELKSVNEELKTSDIKDKKYVEVSERVKGFRKLFPNGAIETGIVSLADGTVVIKATAKNENGIILSTGIAYEKEGSTFINKTSYIENCETSAVGRCLGFLGIGIDGDICSYDEKANADVQADEQRMKEQSQEKISEMKVKALVEKCKNENVDVTTLCGFYGVDKFADLTEAQFYNINQKWKKILERVKDGI